MHPAFQNRRDDIAEQRAKLILKKTQLAVRCLEELEHQVKADLDILDEKVRDDVRSIIESVRRMLVSSSERGADPIIIDAALVTLDSLFHYLKMIQVEVTNLGTDFRPLSWQDL